MMEFTKQDLQALAEAVSKCIGLGHLDCAAVLASQLVQACIRRQRKKPEFERKTIACTHLGCPSE